MTQTIQPGQKVKPSSYRIQRARDAWLNCGREPFKTTLETEMKRLIAQRGTLLEVVAGKYSPFYCVDWGNGTISECLSDQIQSADD